MYSRIIKVHVLDAHDFTQYLWRLSQGLQSENVVRNLENEMHPDVILWSLVD